MPKMPDETFLKIFIRFAATLFLTLRFPKRKGKNAISLTNEEYIRDKERNLRIREVAF